MNPFWHYALARHTGAKTTALAMALLSGHSAEQLATTTITHETLQKLEHEFTAHLPQLEALGVTLLCFGEADYPTSLRNVDSPPLMLYLRGSLPSAPRLAIVGSRGPTDYGKQVTALFAAELSRAGMCIVSGLALGIDAIAHQNAVGTRGNTIAVLGSGIDLITPHTNRPLGEAILAQGGAILSEFPPGTPALPANFPRRNRIISGLSLGVVLIEAAIRSGTMITARLALEQGREVFAVPGNIFSPKQAGCHRMIQDGARLVTSSADILEVLAQPGIFATDDTPAPPALPIEQQTLLQVLAKTDVTSIGDLQQHCGQEGTLFMESLAELELLGYITLDSGNVSLNRSKA